MKKGIVTLSFDDGRKDNYRIAKDILSPYKVPATFNIATGFIEGLCDVGKNRVAPMSKSELIEIYQDELFEIAAHGDLHKNDIYDIQSGRNKLINWLGLPEDYLIGFASPGSDMTADYIKNHESELRRLGFLYIRTGLNIKSKHRFRILSRKLSRVLHSKLLFRCAYKDTVQIMNDGIVMTSIPILHDTSLKEIFSIIEYAEKKKAVVTLMFHSVVKSEEVMHDNTWSYDYNKFKQLIEYLILKRKNNKIEILSTKEAYRYL